MTIDLFRVQMQKNEFGVGESEKSIEYISHAIADKTYLFLAPW